MKFVQVVELRTYRARLTNQNYSIPRSTVDLIQWIVNFRRTALQTDQLRRLIQFPTVCA